MTRYALVNYIKGNDSANAALAPKMSVSARLGPRTGALPNGTVPRARADQCDLRVLEAFPSIFPGSVAFFGKYRQMRAIRDAVREDDAETVTGHEPLHCCDREMPEVTGWPEMLPVLSGAHCGKVGNARHNEIHTATRRDHPSHFAHERIHVLHVFEHVKADNAIPTINLAVRSS